MCVSEARCVHVGRENGEGWVWACAVEVVHEAAFKFGEDLMVIRSLEQKIRMVKCSIFPTSLPLIWSICLHNFVIRICPFFFITNTTQTCLAFSQFFSILLTGCSHCFTVFVFCYMQSFGMKKVLKGGARSPFTRRNQLLELWGGVVELYTNRTTHPLVGECSLLESNNPIEEEKKPPLVKHYVAFKGRRWVLKNRSGYTVETAEG